jgi:tetratricopeptide (TPR) repeat protein
MIENKRYFYLYYNQFVGGLRGAWSNYETDYYYVSQTEASEWLISYLEAKGLKEKVRIKATYSVHWQFRNHPEIETSYFRYDERSQSDWDYAIAANRYISPHKLRNGIWPPENAIHIIYADSVPICAVLERKSKDAYYGYLAFSEGKNTEAVTYFEKALEIDDKDEMIFYNFAAALYRLDERHMADSLLKEGLKINPEFEPVLMYLGNIARTEERYDLAVSYYERLIEADRKYFEAYVALAGLVLKTDIMRARKLLRTCITINPLYKPAITALADTYRSTDPEIADKYDKLAESIK